MKRLLSVLLFQFVILLSQQTVQAGNIEGLDKHYTQIDEAGIAVDASLNQEKGLRLHFSIRNVGSKEIALPKDLTPWAVPQEITLTAIPLNLDPPQKQLHMIFSDPGSAITILRSGESVEGDINLPDIIEGFDRMVHRSDVAIFWSFVLPVNINQRATACGPFQGFLTIRRK